ncbi:MAG: AI-2E family transporter [Peptoniphilaceae bacterium]|nr:AI-2E family transporter [Anaerococcus sp.]MDD7045218.1 AI-2E family transporter [Peptoniphilaceae bacterium]
MDKKALYQRFAIRILIILGSILFSVYVLPGLLDSLMPILVAFAIAYLIWPIVEKINDLLPIKQKFLSYIIGTGLLVILIILGFWVFGLILNQIIGLISQVIRDWPSIRAYIESIINKLSSDAKLWPPVVTTIINNVLNSVFIGLNSLKSTIFNKTVNITGQLIDASSTIIFFTITFITAFYIILGNMEIFIKQYERSISKSSRESIGIFWKVFKASTVNYVKSQLILAFLCFVITALVLYFTGQEFFLAISLLVAFVDILPLVGTVVVLIPWSLVEFLVFSNSEKALILLVLALGWQLIRQAISPKIIGESADIHPLISTIALYAGLRMGGIVTAIFAPVVAIFIVGLIKSGLLDNWLYDFKEVFVDIKSRLNIKKRRLNPPKD